MSWAEEFNKLSISSKQAFISVATLIPFWLVAIYLLNRPLYDTGDYIIIGAFCLCFSVTWYFVGVLIAMGQGRKEKRKVDGKSITFVGGIISVMYLSTTIVVSYYFELRFAYFLILSYSYSVINLFRHYLIPAIEREMNRPKSESGS